MSTRFGRNLRGRGHSVAPWLTAASGLLCPQPAQQSPEQDPHESVQMGGTVRISGRPPTGRGSLNKYPRTSSNFKCLWKYSAYTHFTVPLKQHCSVRETSSVSTLDSGNCDSLTWAFKTRPAHQPHGHRAEWNPQSLLLRLPDT